ncbi:hypothetical protein [Nonomuraea sp. NPDC002799]
MPSGDDLEKRFNELVSQIDADEQRKMRAAAKKAAKEPSGSVRPSRPGGHVRAWADDGHPAGRPRRAGRTWLALACVMALIAASGTVVIFRPDLLGPGGPVPEETMPVEAASWPAETGGPVPEETAPVSPAPEPERPELRLFEGTPAEDYAEGAAGFVMPKAKAIGGLSKKDVAKGLARARALLAASNLDRKTLMGGKPKKFMELLHPDERSWFAKNLGRRKPWDSRVWVTSFAPKTAEQASKVIKVNGRAKLSSFKKKNGLAGAKLTTNYIVVHAIQRPGQPDTAMRLVTHERGTMLMYRDTRGLIIWVEDWGGSSTPARCDTKDGYIHPSYADSVPDKVGATGPPSDPYDLDTPEVEGECGASKGT